MNPWIKTLTTGFQNIGVSGNVIDNWSAMNVLPTVQQEQIVHINPLDYVASITENNSVELLIIDLDTFGVDKSAFLIFLTSCFKPETPLVLVTEKTLSATDRKKLNTGRVLRIIELDNSLNTRQIACA